MQCNNSLTVSSFSSVISSNDGYNSNTSITANTSLPLISSFFARITNHSVVRYPTGILPPGVLAITDNCVVYERPPQYQNIQVIFDQVDNINYENSKIRVYRLPIPWQLYIATYTSFNDCLYPNTLRMYFMKNSIHHSGANDAHLYLPPLTNFYANGLLCRPMYSDYEDVNRYSNDISGIVSATYDWVWNTGTNLDLTMAPVELLLQAKHFSSNNYILNSSFSNEVSISSYYLPSPSVHGILSRWESLDSLHDISNYDWPNPAPVERPSTEPFVNRSNYLDEYLHRYDLEDYHSCDSDQQDCDCTPHYDEDHFYEYVRTSFFSPKTFSQIMKYVQRDDLSGLTSYSPSFDHFSKYIQNSSYSLAN